MNEATLSKPNIRVLIVEDSAVAREFLVDLIGGSSELVVVGVACDGEEAVAEAVRLRPDVITMDINMPRMNGFEATRAIMEVQPTPIVIVSGSWDPKEVQTVFLALEAGAVSLVSRPRGIGHPSHADEVRDLLRLVRSMADVKVVRRWATAKPAHANRHPLAPAPLPALNSGPTELVAIGASTGGPLVLQEILSRLPPNLPFPIAIVQHMSTGFVEGFVEWLGNSAKFQVRLAKNGDVMQPGHAYVAGDGRHMTLSFGKRITLSEDPPDGGLRPSVAHLFQSAAKAYGSRVAAILLTGMGADGANELKLLRELGATTVVQSRETCVVFGMPGTAVRLDAASLELSPAGIADFITSIATTRSAKQAPAVVPKSAL